MRFEISNHDPEVFGNRQVRLTIDADRELAGEILDFAYQRFEELDKERADDLFKRMFGR